MTADDAPGRLAFVGGFTTPHRLARGKGIHTYDADVGVWRERACLTDLVNPSFLTVDRRRGVLFCVHGDGEYASAFAIDRDTGKLTAINHAKTGGLNGVHHALDPTGRFLLVANHDSGSLGVLPVGGDGALGDAVQIFDLPGERGPRREQFSAQPHQVVFDSSGRFAIVPAKGLDRVFIFDFDTERGRLSLRDSGHAVLKPGAGPRHLAFHPTQPFLFVVNEIDSSVALCEWDTHAGCMKPLRTVPTLPSETSGANTASAIAITGDGRHVYVSNRGHDSIAHYAFNEGAAHLSSADWIAANGACPRFMMLDPHGDRLLVAAEQGDCISAFPIDRSTGRLTLSGVMAHCASPSAIDFL